MSTRAPRLTKEQADEVAECWRMTGGDADEAGGIGSALHALATGATVTIDAEVLRQGIEAMEFVVENDGGCGLRMALAALKEATA